MVKVLVAGADYVHLAGNGGGNDVIIVRIIGHDTHKLLFLGLNRSRQSGNGRHSTLDLMLIETVQLLQSGITQHAAKFCQEKW